jgi:hypothetical protein
MKNLFKKLFEIPSNFLLKEVNQRRIRTARLYRELVQRESNHAGDLRAQFAPLINQMDKRARLRLHERRFFSQNGEDGLLLHFLTQIGAPHKTFVEFGVADGWECNAANLAIHFGWTGLFVEGVPELAAQVRQFYHQRHGLDPQRVKVTCQFITRENVNRVLTEQGFHGEVDLLSLDIDGNDYWAWQAIDAVSPRLVVIEYNASFGPDRSITVRYDPAFDRDEKHTSGWYHGASLRALDKLARAKGYVLVGCDSAGANAFFVRKELAAGKVDEFSVEDAFYPNAPRLREKSQTDQFKVIEHLPYDEV